MEVLNKYLCTKNDKANTRMTLLGIIFLTALIYSPILSNDFLYYWDDQWQVFNQYTEGGINLKNIHNILTQPLGGQYSPINEIMYLLIYSINKYDPFYFHLASLSIHCINIWLVFLLFSKLFNFTKSRIQCINSVPIIWLITLIFAIHPLNVESIAWISASKVVLYTLFYLLASYTYCLFLTTQHWRYYIYTIVFFILSFGSKEQAITFPLWISLITWISGYDIPNDTKKYLKVVPFFIMAILFFYITINVQSTSENENYFDGKFYPLWQRIVFCCYSMIEYLSKFILPYKLNYLYPFPVETGEALPYWLLLYPLFISIIGVSLWKYIMHRPIMVGLLIFFIHISTVLHIVPIARYAIVADRYMYMPILGFCFIFAYYFQELGTKSEHHKKYYIVALILLSIILSINTFMRCKDWQNSEKIRSEHIR